MGHDSTIIFAVLYIYSEKLLGRIEPIFGEKYSLNTDADGTKKQLIMEQDNGTIDSRSVHIELYS